MLHRTNDSFRATNPADEFLGPEPEDEDEIPEPSIEEVWDGGRGEYVTQVTMPSGKKFTVRQTLAGRFIGDFEIVGPDGFYSDGYTSVEKALSYLTDIEHWGW